MKNYKKKLIYRTIKKIIKDIMKHLKEFEQHNTVNEWMGQETLTGWSSKEEKQKAKDEILSQIEQKIEKYKQNPDAFIKYDETTLRKKLIQNAEDDNYKGKVVIQSSPAGPKKLYINYIDGRKKYNYRTL